MKIKKIIHNHKVIAYLCFFVDFSEKEILKETTKILKKCVAYLLPKSIICIGVNPTFSFFVKNKIQGVAGYTPLERKEKEV